MAEEVIAKGDLDTVIEELKKVAPQDYKSRFWHKKRGVKTGDGKTYKLVIGDQDKQPGQGGSGEDKSKEPKSPDKPKEPKEPKDRREDKSKEPKSPDKPKEPKEPKDRKEGEDQKEGEKPPKSEEGPESNSGKNDSDKDGEESEKSDSKADEGEREGDGEEEEEEEEYEDVDDDWGKEGSMEGTLPGLGKYSKGRESDGRPDDAYRDRDKKTMEMDSSYFARRLKAVLKDNAVHRPSRNKIYGDLSHKSLYKIATTSKIFERKQLYGKKDYYIGLIVDCSGSMSGWKCDMAAFSAKTLIKEFQEVTKICVTTFNRKNKLIRKFEDKKFDVKRLEQVSWDIHRDTRSSDACDNYDVDALRFMFEQMKHIRMGHKAMIILSDGEPQFRKGDNEDTFRSTVKQIEKTGIPVLSIGVQDDRVSEFYTTYEVVHNVPSLYDAIIKMIQKHVGVL